jgi:tRNA(adenine34) deaminase
MTDHETTDEHWMHAALSEAERARDERETPVGALIVHNGVVVGRGYNQVETLGDPTAHAEILAIGAAANTLASWRLDGCELFVTLEPCAMCTGAAILARIGRIVYGAREPRSGACGSMIDLPAASANVHRVQVEGGLLADESADLLRTFFREVRRGTNGKPQPR